MNLLKEKESMYNNKTFQYFYSTSRNFMSDEAVKLKMLIFHVNCMKHTLKINFWIYFLQLKIFIERIDSAIFL